ncbi:hypothetical protein WN51_06525 [Melipona quadrifasciata]|uniref:Uncharacterized protein n=1 Tax=Melipona quadrifasciata TaxID=166423 RepID=A0A0M8ZSG3_9HYME|nr:hypothetical protein WN51_06525 [Melipona quadrifasciata]
MLRVRDLCTVSVKQELIARLTTNDPAGSWMHGHGSNMNSVGANEDTDVSENSPSTSEEVNDSQVVNILLNKRAESRKCREGDLRALHDPGQNVLWTVRDVKIDRKRSSGAWEWISRGGLARSRLPPEEQQLEILVSAFTRRNKRTSLGISMHSCESQAGSAALFHSRGYSHTPMTLGALNSRHCPPAGPDRYTERNESEKRHRARRSCHFFDSLDQVDEAIKCTCAVYERRIKFAYFSKKYMQNSESISHTFCSLRVDTFDVACFFLFHEEEATLRHKQCVERETSTAFGMVPDGFPIEQGVNWSVYGCSPKIFELHKLGLGVSFDCAIRKEPTLSKRKFAKFSIKGYFPHTHDEKVINV